MQVGRVREMARATLSRLLVLYTVLLLFPVEYRVTRLLTVLGACSIWGMTLFLWWRNRRRRVFLLGGLVLAALLLAMPGRRVSASALRADYMAVLRVYGHARYVWGGESPLGIDCSGLVRKGLVWGQALNGLRTLNGTPLRNAVLLWWHDCSARALRDGYRGLTSPLFTVGSINGIDYGALELGDLAVTVDGVHTMAYVGNRTWMEADPDLGRVVEVTVPTENPWFKIPVVLVRWQALANVRLPTDRRVGSERRERWLPAGIFGGA